MRHGRKAGPSAPRSLRSGFGGDDKVKALRKGPHQCGVGGKLLTEVENEKQVPPLTTPKLNYVWGPFRSE